MPEESPVTDRPDEKTNDRKKPKKLGGGGNETEGALQKTAPAQENSEDDEDAETEPEPQPMPKRRGGRRMVPVHQSRIADRPPKVGEKDSSLKIKIELDLEVEVEIYARVKGDVTIGLM
ncbi:hypothetical protein DPSP01_003429 [Paraphaeosphaeria sporulosa]